MFAIPAVFATPAVAIGLALAAVALLAYLAGSD